LAFSGISGAVLKSSVTAPLPPQNKKERGRGGRGGRGEIEERRGRGGRGGEEGVFFESSPL